MTKTSPAELLRPIFIVSPPRSGSSLLFQTLGQARGIFTIGGESHSLIERIPGLHPRAGGWSSNRLLATHATPVVIDALARSFFAQLRDRDGHAPDGHATMIEKTPKNSLRIPFLTAAFPNARFIYLYRDPRATMSSMIEAWESGRFRTYPLLPDWPNTPWSLLLVPGWRGLATMTLAEIVAHQWARTTSIMLHDLVSLPRAKVTAIDYRDLITDPQSAIAALCKRIGLVWDRKLDASLPLSPTVVSAPEHEKWRRSEALIDRLMPLVETADQEARTALAIWRNAAAISQHDAP